MRPGEEVIVTALPLYHIFALMVNFITYFSIGAENWLVANPRDLDGLVDVLDEAKPSVFMGVNTLYAGLAAHPRLDSVDFSRLRLAGGGGAAVMPATSARWEGRRRGLSSARAMASRRPVRFCHSILPPSTRLRPRPACRCPARTSRC
jgi:acyl-CoA synthetase (AMP-forming)/AMP-acid ligase II